MPLWDPGPHLLESQLTELELLRLFISDDMLQKFIVATNAYAEAQKEAKQAMYTRFKRTPLTKEELIRYIGVLLLLSVNSVRNYRKAWERKSSQVRITTVNKSYVQVCIWIKYAFYLLLCRFLFVCSIWWPEAGFHLVTPAEDPLKKVHPFYDALKVKFQELYQPLRQLSVDERMVKSKARTHFRQYIRNKPTKWGFKFWVLADPTEYTLDYNLYCGRQRSSQFLTKD